MKLTKDEVTRMINHSDVIAFPAPYIDQILKNQEDAESLREVEKLSEDQLIKNYRTYSQIVERLKKWYEAETEPWITEYLKKILEE